MQLLAVVLSPVVRSDMINDALENCNQKTSVPSQTWQWAWIWKSLSPHPQLWWVCQIKDTSFLHDPWLTCFTNTPPVSEVFPSKHGDRCAQWAQSHAGLQVVRRNGYFNSYWPFEVLQVSSLRLALVLWAMLKILLVLLKRCVCSPSHCFSITVKFWSR